MEKWVMGDFFPPASLCGSALRCFMLWYPDMDQGEEHAAGKWWLAWIFVCVWRCCVLQLGMSDVSSCGSHDCSTGRLWAVCASQPHDGSSYLHRQSFLTWFMVCDTFSLLIHLYQVTGALLTSLAWHNGSTLKHLIDLWCIRSLTRWRIPSLFLHCGN